MIGLSLEPICFLVIATHAQTTGQDDDDPLPSVFLDAANIDASARD
jgi:hypothetical protein